MNTKSKPKAEAAKEKNKKESQQVSEEGKNAPNSSASAPEEDFGGLQGEENFRRNMGCGG